MYINFLKALSEILGSKNVSEKELASELEEQVEQNARKELSKARQRTFNQELFNNQGILWLITRNHSRSNEREDQLQNVCSKGGYEPG